MSRTTRAGAMSLCLSEERSYAGLMDIKKGEHNRSRGRSIASVARDFNIHISVLRRWVSERRDDKEHSFPARESEARRQEFRRLN